MIEVGRVLFTKDGRKIGNAIVLNIEQVEDAPIVTIETDFGNIVKLTEDEVVKDFHEGHITIVNDWIEQRDYVRHNIYP